MIEAEWQTAVERSRDDRNEEQAAKETMKKKMSMRLWMEQAGWGLVQKSDVGDGWTGAYMTPNSPSLL